MSDTDSEFETPVELVIVFPVASYSVMSISPFAWIKVILNQN